jgi:hypothetical protein
VKLSRSNQNATHVYYQIVTNWKIEAGTQQEEKQTSVLKLQIFCHFHIIIINNPFSTLRFRNSFTFTLNSNIKPNSSIPVRLILCYMREKIGSYTLIKERGRS